MFKDDGEVPQDAEQVGRDRADRLARYVSMLVGKDVEPDYHKDYLVYAASRMHFLFRFEDENETSILIDRTCRTCSQVLQTPKIRVTELKDILSAHYFGHVDCQGAGGD